jgi:hypothetical protein
MINTQAMFDMFNLVELQNHPANINQDHLTISGMFDTVEQFHSLAEKMKRNIEQMEGKSAKRYETLEWSIRNVFSNQENGDN